jgi:protocatechuate 3,4-dioxygenase beta subunit
VLILSP